ncbi:hypothetical protein ALC57_13237, partial [Trachymyrmex cornetzi]
TIIRSAFTRNLNSLHAEMEEESPNSMELQVRLSMVREKASQLEEINQKIFEVMIESEMDEQDLIQETNAADEYQRKYQQAKIAVSNILEKAQSTVTSEDGQVTQVSRDNKRTYKSSKIQLPQFIGDLKDWLHILQTLRVKLFCQGKEQVVRAVFDTGSHRSYIVDHYAEKMKFEVVGEQLIVHMLFGGSRSRPLSHREYRVHIKSMDGSYSCDFIALK